MTSEAFDPFGSDDDEEQFDVHHSVPLPSGIQNEPSFNYDPLSHLDPPPPPPIPPPQQNVATRRSPSSQSIHQNQQDRARNSLNLPKPKQVQPQSTPSKHTGASDEGVRRSKPSQEICDNNMNQSGNIDSDKNISITDHTSKNQVDENINQFSSTFSALTVNNELMDNFGFIAETFPSNINMAINNFESEDRKEGNENEQFHPLAQPDTSHNTDSKLWNNSQLQEVTFRISEEMSIIHKSEAEQYAVTICGNVAVRS